ncbi:MAG: PKD domain-containing protein [Chloroflexota bacterium]|nr:PKD domain-containing protein [Chloroflexota bacterium]
MNLRQRTWIAVGLVILVGAVVVAGLAIVLLPVSASSLRQFPTSSVTVISDPPPPDLPGQSTEVTLLSNSVADPHPLWRSRTFDDSGWQYSYPAAMMPGWGAPVGGTTSADFIWGGPPGSDVGGRYEIPASPAPQFLFLRKNFCVPINADVTSIQADTPLDIQIAASPGDASVYYNSVDIVSYLSGREDGGFYTLNLDPIQIASARYVGRNTLAMSIQDDVGDARAAVAFHLRFSYNIDSGAITVNSTPPSGSAVVGDLVTFSQGGTGPGGDPPYTLRWDFGDGTISIDPTHSYTAAGTYTVTLIMTDSFGCPSAPVSAQYVVSEPPTPTFTPTPIPTLTSTPTPTSAPVIQTSTSAPQPPPQPTHTPVQYPTPVPTIPVLLPETGDTEMISDEGIVDSGPGPLSVCTAVIWTVGGGLLITVYFLLRRHFFL